MYEVNGEVYGSGDKDFVGFIFFIKLEKWREVWEGGFIIIFFL